MYFVGVMTMSRRDHDSLFMVVKRFQKMCDLIPCNNTIISHEEENLFANILIHFGFQSSMMSNRESRGNFGEHYGKGWTQS